MVVLDHFKGNMTIKLDLVVCTHLSLFTHIVGDVFGTIWSICIFKSVSKNTARYLEMTRKIWFLYIHLFERHLLYQISSIDTKHGKYHSAMWNGLSAFKWLLVASWSMLRINGGLGLKFCTEVRVDETSLVVIFRKKIVRYGCHGNGRKCWFQWKMSLSGRIFRNNGSFWHFGCAIRFENLNR